MAYKVTISDGTILEKSIDSVAFNADTPSDNFYETRDYTINSMTITGRIGTGENTISLYKWALLPASNPKCYKEIEVEQTHADQVIRKVKFSMAFVVDYSESFAKHEGAGYFSILVRQMSEIDIDVTSQSPQGAIIDSKPETIIEKEVVPVVAQVASAIVTTKKPESRMSFTDRIANQKEIQHNNISTNEFKQVAYGSTDLSQLVIEYKKQKNIAGGANVAVFEYEKNGVLMYAISESIPPKHSEQIIHKKLTEELGINPSQVKRIYSEREPCTLRAWNCKKLIQKNYPHAETTYSFEYGDEESRKRGNKEHKKATSQLFK